MDEVKLRQLWQSFIGSSPKDSEDKRHCLSQLLDLSMCYYNDGKCVQDRSARYCIGSWITHQFIIDLSNASTKQNEFNCEYHFVSNYFANNLGLKLLKCIYHLNGNDAALYNPALSQLLVHILKQYLISYLEENDDVDEPSDAIHFSKQDVCFLKESFVGKSKYNQQVYLRTLHCDTLSPAKVKSWIKTPNRKYSHGKKGVSRANDNNDDDDSECDSDETILKRSGGAHSTVKFVPNANRLICSQTALEHDELRLELMQLCEQFFKNQNCPQTVVGSSVKWDTVDTIGKILADFVQFEYRATTPLNESNSSKLSFLVIGQLSSILVHLLSSSSSSSTTERKSIFRYNLMMMLKNLILTACFTVAKKSSGVRLIHTQGILTCMMQLLRQIESLIRERGVLQQSDEQWTEYCHIFFAIIQLLIDIAQNLVSTKEFVSFANIMRLLFHSSQQILLQSMLFLCESRNHQEGSEHEYSLLYRMIDLLSQLQVSLQYSQSLYAHKQFCTKRRHKKCDLTAQMVHHLYHERIFGGGTSGANKLTPSTYASLEELPCFVSIIYNVLINLIFICSTRSTEGIDKLLGHICNHLSSLISCCWSLKTYFKRLLYFAVNTERSSNVRNAIFAIIEFGIKMQRKSLTCHHIGLVEKCTFCTQEEICDNGPGEFVHTEVGKGSDKSEGYLTDNCGGSSLATKTRLIHKDESMCPREHCFDSNCLIELLSTHYLSLLHNESATVRQTIFRHLLNLFSYLSCPSRVSLLYHIVFPVLQNVSRFPIDVSLFTMRLLIFIAERSNQEEGDLDLLVAFTQTDGFLLLKQLIMTSQQGGEKSLEESHSLNLSFLAISLMECFIKRELIFRERQQIKLATTHEMHSLPAISLLMQLYLDQFSLYKHLYIRPSVFGSMQIAEEGSLRNYIDYYKKVSFNIFDMTEQEISRMSSNFNCLHKLLVGSNNLLSEHSSLRTILGRYGESFAEKLCLFFQQTFQLILNEIKLYHLINYHINTNNNSGENDDSDDTLLDTSKYSVFFGKVLRVIEQLLSMLLQIEPFPFNGGLCGPADLAPWLKDKLDGFLVDINLIQWHCFCTVDPLQELFKMLLTVAFNSSKTSQRNRPSELDDSTDLEQYLSRNPRSNSFDSLISDNETTNNDTVEMDSYDPGYQADTEFFKSASVQVYQSQWRLSGKKFDEQQQKQQQTQQESVCTLRYVDLCKIVVLFLSESLQRKRQLCNNGQLSLKLLKLDLDSSLSLVNLLIRYCRENPDNSRLMFENGFTTMIMHSFHHLLTSTELEFKPIKFALFNLFVEICRYKLDPKELKLWLDLFKEEDADLDFLLTTTQKVLFFKHTDPFHPLHSVRYPVISKVLPQRDLLKSNFWLDSIVANVKYNHDVNESEQISFRSFACALPLNGDQMPNDCFSVAFWIYIDKVNPLVDKSTYNHSNGSNSGPNSQSGTTYQAKNSKCIHIISLAFQSTTLELWLDYVYNRFVYRICKESNGKFIYPCEAFVSNPPNFLGKWNFIRFNVELVSSIPKMPFKNIKSIGHTHLHISHSGNCSKDECFKLTFPSNLLKKIPDKVALLLGSVQTDCAFYYRLGNVFLFKQHLQPSTTVFLFSLGADFTHLHQLKSESLSQDDYFVLPRQLVRESNTEMIRLMEHCISPNTECTFILSQLVLLYRISQPTIYFACGLGFDLKTVEPPISRFQPQSSNKRKQTGPPNELKQHNARLYSRIKSKQHYSVSKTIAESGGISLFIFLFCYLYEKSESQTVYYKALELLVRVYDSHCQHRTMFDRYYTGSQLILYALEQSRKPFGSNILRVFSQFSIDSTGEHTIIVSSYVEIFLNSWKVWNKSVTTNKLFFSKLQALVSQSNPYRNYNMAQLRRANVFARIMYMIKDMYVNYNQSNTTSEQQNVCLDSDSLNYVISILKSFIDSSTDLSLFKSVFNCVLILQKSELLHVNQTRTSFYYLFPSTWLTNKDIVSDVIEQDPSSIQSELNAGCVVVNDNEVEGNLNLEEWEVVSEIFDGPVTLVAPAPQENELITSPVLGTISPSKSNNSEKVVCQLLLLINRLVDQLSEISSIDTLFEKLLSLDYLLIFVNTWSDQVREMALTTYFKYYNLRYSKKNGLTGSERTKRVSNLEDSKVIKSQTLHLLLLANQLYLYTATEEIVYLCLSFLLEMNTKNTRDLFQQENVSLLRRSLQKVSLEKFVPFLAVLPRCIDSIDFCHRLSQMFAQIMNTLSVEQVAELQHEYGLVQSLSKLIINFNTQLSLSIDEMNKCTKEHVNEKISKIVFDVARNYLLKSGTLYLESFNNLLHYFGVMQRKVSHEVAIIFRLMQVAILQGSYEALNQIKNGYLDNNSQQRSDNNLEIFAEHYFHVLSGSDYLHSTDNFSGDFFLADSNLDKKKTPIHDVVKPKEILERFKIVIKKSCDFVICRDDTLLSQKEIYFQREVLYHLMELVESIESGHMKNGGTNRQNGRNTLSNLLRGSKDLFKKHLSQIVLFLLAPFQKLQDRIFALNLYVEKTKMLEYVTLFCEHNNDKFAALFAVFLTDLIEKGVTKLNIDQWTDQDPADQQQLSEILPHYTNDYSSHSSPSSMHDLLDIFKQNTNLPATNNDKEDIAYWYRKIEQNKDDYESDMAKFANRIFANMLAVYNKVNESATILNDRIMFAQQQEQKDYIEHIREENLFANQVKSQISNLINESLHEKALWHMSQYYPQSWALSPFESRDRVRKKLERCFLEIDSRFVIPSSKKQLHSKSLFDTLLGTNSQRILGGSLSRQQQHEPVQSLLYTTSARVILFDEEIAGEILVKKSLVQFFANQIEQSSNCVTTSKRAFFQNFVIHFTEIQEIFNCRYELQNNAVEIYLNCGLTYLIAFESTTNRDKFIKHLTNDREALPNLAEKVNLVTLTQLWRDRRISNFEYLTHLNKLSGRTSNDLMQYPVFPFIIADYHSELLNLKETASFRILSRPIAIQKRERERHYVEQYNYIKTENERNRQETGDTFQFVVTSAPYHYGSHYSNSGIVLHFLVRLPPYTQMFLQYQDKNFDIPDRTFHSMHTTWRLATEDSTNGFKELIPEFFYLPEFLMNNEQYNLGTRQNGERVNHVILPKWCRNDARLFVLINRQALESNLVTQQLNHWIDLIFGFQQSGKAAIEAINVFHPATHFTSDLSKIEDDVKRHAIKTMIKTFGQMPTQLFNMPHPSVSSDAPLPIEDDQQLVSNWMPEVIGLKWGNYVGSPIFAKPTVCYQRKFPMPIARLWALPTNDVFLLPQNASLLVTYNQQRNIFINALYIVSYSLCVWSNIESTIWIKNKEDKSVFTYENQMLDTVCICESIPDLDCLLIGYLSGLIMSFPLNALKNANVASVSLMNRPIILSGHRAAITCISMNKNYSVALSGDADGVFILWDLSKHQYIRTVLDYGSCWGPAKFSCISDTLGDFAVVSYGSKDNGPMVSKLNVFTINGTPVGEVVNNEEDGLITCLCYSTCTEGLAINVIATGFSNGNVKLWSSWDLTLVRQIKLHQVRIPIQSISYSFANDLLYIVLKDNHLIALENSSSPFISHHNSSHSSRKNFRLLDLTYMNGGST